MIILKGLGYVILGILAIALSVIILIPVCLGGIGYCVQQMNKEIKK